MRIFGVILAGGQGRRMGGADKALLTLGGVPLIRHAVNRLDPQVEDLAISANGDPLRFAAFGRDILSDDQPMGPLSGVLAALDWAAARGATAVVSCPVDAPFAPGDLVPRLILAAETAPSGLALARSKDRDHPVFALWPVTVRGDLRLFLASGVKPKVLDFADAEAAARAEFPADDAFLNINAPEDLARAEAMLKVGP
ncbi:MAG: molybdenum cofactor guanylyltransferase MobA [Tabrizicola sp.]|nr:molybdenum cofactor guanylyltransferase MobA [Tabrizicola sp.]